MCPRLRGPVVCALYAPGTVRFLFWAKKCPKVDQAPRGVLRIIQPLTAWKIESVLKLLISYLTRQVYHMFGVNWFAS